MKQSIGTILGVAITVGAILAFIGGTIWSSTGNASNSMSTSANSATTATTATNVSASLSPDNLFS